MHPHRKEIETLSDIPPALRHLGLAAWLQPDVLIPVSLFALLYVVAARHARAAFGAKEWAAFATALLLIYLGFGGPLDLLADHYLFSAHMLQHLLLTMVSAPLLLIATPPELLSPLLRHASLRAVLATLTRPALALTLFTLTMAASVWPPVYDLTLRNEPLHLLEHAVFFITALAMWWPLLSRVPELPPLRPGQQSVYIWLAHLPMLLPLPLVLLSGTVLYSVYLHAPTVFGIGHLTDQQLGVAIMASGMEGAYLVAFLYAFRAWFRSERLTYPDGTIPLSDGFRRWFGVRVRRS